ncbi:hypothetical protein E2C01_044859 [Portunus trituberculatus]|uniref:Uncharacterized protein n=1 Tax=Portunus trituberculatus TaxID=210409 RepID=A0A5B7FWP8_PORTR|nr:hypothetical protein [Portunus trituberculatus]
MTWVRRQAEGRDVADNVDQWGVRYDNMGHKNLSQTGTHPVPQQQAWALRWFARGFLVYDVTYTRDCHPYHRIGKCLPTTTGTVHITSLPIPFHCTQVYPDGAMIRA